MNMPGLSKPMKLVIESEATRISVVWPADECEFGSFIIEDLNQLLEAFPSLHEGKGRFEVIIAFRRLPALKEHECEEVKS